MVERPYARRHVIATIAFVVLFGSVATTTLPGLSALLQQSIELRKYSYKERRARVAPSGFHEALNAVESTLSRNEPLALILNAHRHNVGLAMLVDYYFYPRRVNLYFARSIYNADRSPERPAAIAYVQYGHDPFLRRLSYEEVRAEDIGSSLFVTRPEPAFESSSFIVPIVASGDGPAPDTYTTETLIENAFARPARVAFELFPSRRRAEITLAAQEARTWNDLVYQLFGVLEVGWVRIQSDAPVRCAFWFVNRGRHSVSPIPPVMSMITTARFDVPRGGRVWILNPIDHALALTVSGASHSVPLFSLTGLPRDGVAAISSTESFFAFASWRDAAGRTSFAWPSRQ